jgi:hypothetical protein
MDFTTYPALTVEQKEALDRDGYLVIPDVISEALADETLSEFQAFHAHCTGQQFDPEHYSTSLEFKNVHGIIEFPGALSHVDFVQKIRDEPSVQGVFQAIYETPEPIVMSMDRVNYQGSSEQRGFEARDRKAWWHVDQKYDKPKRECIQAYIDVVGS